MRAFALSSFLGLAGCAAAGLGCQTNEDPPPIVRNPGLIKLEIQPADAHLVIQTSQPADIDFKALGTFSGRSIADDISAKVAWMVADHALGAFGADSKTNRFRSSVTRGGRTTVTASSPPLPDATATVTVVYSAALLRMGAPPDAAALFDAAAEEASESPRFVAPQDGTSVSPADSPPEFRWTSATGTDLFELTFSNDVTDLRIYTIDTTVTPSAQEWSILGETDRGAAVQVKLRGMRAAQPGTAGSAAPLTLDFSP